MTTSCPLFQQSKENDKSNFVAFNSALFISEYQEGEENSVENSNKENKNTLNNNRQQEFQLNDSLENCLTNELLDSIAHDSNETKKEKKNFVSDFNINTNFNNNNEDSVKILKITKNMFANSNQNSLTKEKSNIEIKLVKDEENAIYEDEISGFEYQLKYIENSLHNILPKSYKKAGYNKNNGFAANYNKNKIPTFCCKNKFNINDMANSDENNMGNFPFVTPFNCNNYPFVNNINNSGNNNNEYFNNKKIRYQAHKLKVNENNYYQWKCNNCNYANKGYRKVCVNCRKNKKGNF